MTGAGQGPSRLGRSMLSLVKMEGLGQGRCGTDMIVTLIITCAPGEGLGGGEPTVDIR